AHKLDAVPEPRRVQAPALLATPAIPGGLPRPTLLGGQAGPGAGEQALGADARPQRETPEEGLVVGPGDDADRAGGASAPAIPRVSLPRASLRWRRRPGRPGRYSRGRDRRPRRPGRSTPTRPRRRPARRRSPWTSRRPRPAPRGRRRGRGRGPGRAGVRSVWA